MIKLSSESFSIDVINDFKKLKKTERLNLIENIYFNFKEKLIKYFKIPKYVKFRELEIKLPPIIC